MKRITGLFKYPIKSCGGISVERLNITPDGIEGDHDYILVNARGTFLSQRVVPTMCLVGVAEAGDTLIASFPGKPSLIINRAAPPKGEGTLVDIWEKPGYGTDVGDYAASWFTNCLNIPCRLLRYDPNHPRHRRGHESNIFLKFTDGFPVTVISQESLRDLNDHMPSGHEITMDRFRPSITVAGCPEPFEEDRWNFISSGGTTFVGEKLCERCSIPSIDPKTGVRDPEEFNPIEILKKYRRFKLTPEQKIEQVYFGKNLSLYHVGDVYVGNKLLAECQM